MKTLKITTHSGAVYTYYPDTRCITGGSFDLQEGTLIFAPEIGRSLFMDVPERQEHNSDAIQPGVVSTPVTEIEEIDVGD